MTSIVAGRSCEDSSALSELLVNEAADLLRNLDDDRSAAIDLLVADSLITYAMEAAAEDHAHLVTAANAAMQRIAPDASRGGQR